MTIIFATNNQHKVDEIRAALPGRFSVVGLKEAGIHIDIPEPHDTLEANAEEKARTIYELKEMECFSEDTGLEVRALNHAPGVNSARYAGDGRSSRNNIEKLLAELKNKEDRHARFRTIICLIRDGKTHFFEGICEGTIIDEMRGDSGFGYDPVFIPDGSDKTFAEMRIEEKNRFSHRKKAMDMLVTFLNALEVNH